MKRPARSLVYKTGRVTILLIMLSVPLAARAQDATAGAAGAGAAQPSLPSTADASPAPTAAVPPVRAPWEDRLDEIDQRTRIVERQQELAREAAAASPPARPG